MTEGRKKDWREKTTKGRKRLKVEWNIFYLSYSTLSSFLPSVISIIYVQVVTTRVVWSIIWIEHFLSSVILSSLVFYLQSCSTFSLFYNIRILTTRLSCNNIILQKNTKEYYSDESFFVQIASRRRWPKSPSTSFYRPFLPSIFSMFHLFYVR
jgi:hypothetical protein